MTGWTEAWLRLAAEGFRSGSVALGGEGTADDPIGGALKSWERSSGERHAGWETRDTL